MNDAAAGAGLQVEDPLAGLADGAGGEGVDVGQFVGLGHDGASWARDPPVEFTVSTAGPVSP